MKQHKVGISCESCARSNWIDVVDDREDDDDDVNDNHTNRVERMFRAAGD